MNQFTGKTVVTWLGRILCIICGLSIGGVWGGSSVPHLKDIAYASAVAVGAIYVFILPMLNTPEK